MRLRRLPPLLLASLAAVPLVAQTRTHTAQADPTGSVRIVTTDGDVRIRPGTGNEVRVRDLEGGPDRGIRIQRRNDEVVVDVYDDREIEVTVPPGSRIDVRTRSGDVSVSGITGTFFAETMNGDVTVGGTPASVAFSSISGSITVEEAVDTVRVNTVSGDVEMPRAGGHLRITSTSGDLDIVSQNVVDGIFDSTSGVLFFRGVVRPDAQLAFTSASGRVDLEVARDVDARFDLDNVTGRIRSDLGPEPTRNRYTGGESVRFTNGNGGARIVVRNVSGEVYVMVR
jgi:DUF4097 and DUF4098 domain-containing protein YvlB